MASKIMCEDCERELESGMLCSTCYKIRINSKCPCNSGKKYKDCHLKEYREDNENVLGKLRKK